MRIKMQFLPIKRNPDMAKPADWIIDLGSEGGDADGLVMAECTPEQVAACAESYISAYLRCWSNKTSTNCN